MMTDSFLFFLIFPCFISSCFSALIRSNSTLAGSSSGFCGTSLPCTASCRIDFFRASGKVVLRVVRCSSALPYLSMYGRSSSILATMRCCSASGGIGINNSLILSAFSSFCFVEPSPLSSRYGWYHLRI